MPKYRADIDGLRATAILPVLFFHAGFGFAQGGFVGVETDGRPLYFDDRHLTAHGAGFVAEVLQPVFAGPSGAGARRN